MNVFLIYQIPMFVVNQFSQSLSWSWYLAWQYVMSATAKIMMSMTMIFRSPPAELSRLCVLQVQPVLELPSYWVDKLTQTNGTIKINPIQMMSPRATHL